MQKQELDAQMICHVYQTIMDMSSDGFLIVDKNGKIPNETFIPKIPQNFDIITQ